MGCNKKPGAGGSGRKSRRDASAPSGPFFKRCTTGTDKAKESKKRKRSKSDRGVGKGKRSRHSSHHKSRHTSRGRSHSACRTSGDRSRPWRVPVGEGNRRFPPAPFIMYYLDMLRAAQRSATNGCRPRIVDVVRRAAKCWKSLSTAEKLAYHNRYCAEFTRIQARRRPSS